MSEKTINTHVACADPESVVRGSPKLTFFSVEEGREDPNVSLLNCVSLACRLWPNIEYLLSSFVFFRRSGPVLLRSPILW